MNGTVAQLITLTSYANHYLNGGDIGNFVKHSTFKYCNVVDFQEYDDDTNAYTVLANNPKEWFEYLKNKACKKVRLSYHSTDKNDHTTSAFVGGGGTWNLETIYDKDSDLWGNYWKGDEDKDGWIVTYGKGTSTYVIKNQQYDVAETSEELRKILREIALFAYQIDYPNFGKMFEKGEKTLIQDYKGPKVYDKEFIVWENYSEENQKLLEAATSGFSVFGGMGSWNDVGFPPNSHETYERYSVLTNKLYHLATKAMVCAINKDKFE